jgi:hypothetical protein
MKNMRLSCTELRYRNCSIDSDEEITGLKQAELADKLFRAKWRASYFHSPSDIIRKIRSRGVRWTDIQLTLKKRDGHVKVLIGICVGDRDLWEELYGKIADPLALGSTQPLTEVSTRNVP